jgi:eukaryotic-like serine/threonine-protein kinase
MSSPDDLDDTTRVDAQRVSESATAHDGPTDAALVGDFTFLDLDAERSAEELARTDAAWAGTVGALRLQGEGDLTQPGARFGPFEVCGFLGSGSTGVVLEAVHLASEQRVAIKLLDEALADAPRVRERFRREAVAVSSLHHPHVLRVFAFGLVQQRPFLVMELLRQGSVQDLLQRRARSLPIAEALELGAGLLAGLAEAHARGFLHRDVKPGNLMLDPLGRVKLVDFGLVRWLADPAGLLTDRGARLGTPRYMSPEQAAGLDVDVRSDVYGAGATIYELLTGAVPYDGGTLSDLQAAQLAGPPAPPGSLRPEVWDALGEVVLRMLACDREQRYASASDALAALLEAHSKP